MSLMSIGKFSTKSGISQVTLRRMHESGDFIPAYISSGGTRYYSDEQLDQILGKSSNADINKPVVGYCRVSTKYQKDDLENQINNVKTYMLSRGYQFDIISDVGSGINYNNTGLKKLVSLINGKEISKVVVLYKDRLVRFGFDLIKYLCEINDVEIEIIDNSEYSKDQELTDDLIQIITVFANRLYGSRSKKTKNLIKEVMSNDTIEKDQNYTNTWTRRKIY